MRVFAFFAVQRSDFLVRTLCRVCKVSITGFYAYTARKSGPTIPTVLGRAVVTPDVVRVHRNSWWRVGLTPLTAEQAREDIPVNHKAFQAEMARQALVG